MLLNKLFTIVSQEVSPGSLQCTIALNPEHEIFSGHFPGIPVLPGVCMVQMSKEIFQCVHPGRYDLISADNIKFLAVLVPSEHDRVNFSITYEENTIGPMRVHASFSAGTLVFFKMKATLRMRHE